MPQENDPSLQQLISIRVQRLNATVHGVTMGLLLGLGLFVATNWLIIKGGEVIGPRLALLGQYFIGYRVTFAGSFVGFAYAFALGYIVGNVFALVYNWVANLRGRLGAPKK